VNRYLCFSQATVECPFGSKWGLGSLSSGCIVDYSSLTLFLAWMAPAKGRKLSYFWFAGHPPGAPPTPKHENMACKLALIAAPSPKIEP
jgi:hypothetical protein